MKKLNFITLLILTIITMQSSEAQNNLIQSGQSNIKKISEQGLKYDSFTTPNNHTINLAFIKHGSLIVDIDNVLTYIDPVSMFGTDFTSLPKADKILVTHGHHDHFDADAIKILSKNKNSLISSKEVKEKYESGTAFSPGDTFRYGKTNAIAMPGNSPLNQKKEISFTINFVPAYNITPDHLNFHPKDRGDLGFIFDVDGVRIYIAGDTEDIPDMEKFTNIDIAFLPINQPYTMTPQQAIHAIDMLLKARTNPTTEKLIIYPYHYGDTDLTPIIKNYQNSPDVEIRVRDMQ